jgi:transposase InsO family protein
MDERLQFVARRLAGETMSELCREFGISRKTGYKIFDRYQECGVQGLTDRSRRPFRYAHQLPFQVENYILNVKHEHPSWGARKIRERLIRRFSDIPIPAKSTIHAVLDRYGLVERRGRVRRRAQGTALSLGQKPNELWCTDYKGEFLLGNHQYCYPLTVTDHASRFLLTCEALSSTCEDYAFTVFARLFQERGLPANIRSDNGVPFASAHALFNLSKLAVWWLRLGIGIERILPSRKKPPSRPPPTFFSSKPASMTSSKSSTTNVLTRLWICSARLKSIKPLHALIRACPISTTPFTTRSSSLPAAAASVWAIKRLTSARSLPARRSALKKFTTTSGWSVLWIMI